LYLQAKKLWDGQKSKVDSLERKTNSQEKNLKIIKDSMAVVKKQMEGNAYTIQNQVRIIAIKDSLSTNLNREISEQHSEIDRNRNEGNNFKKQITAYQIAVGIQKKLSDSLSLDILQKKIELAERKKAIGEKETIIKKQWNWLVISLLIISAVCILVFIIFRAYLANKKARNKIAEQKEELQAILEKLQSTQQQLIQSEKMASLGVLVAGIAHEINNPINFINSGVAGIEKAVNKIPNLLQELGKLKEDSTKEEIKVLVDFRDHLQIQNSMDMMPEIIENVKIGINRTIAIVNGLRLYSRVDIEEKSFNDINHIIETSLLLLKTRLKDQIEIKTYYNNLPQIPVYPAKLSQVFINILSNAIDSILEVNNQGNSGLIEIHTREIKSKIIIEFSDTGKGIPDEILNKLFDPFFTTKIVGKGTGLGLSISYGIIAEHNGRIYAKNNNLKGATFIVELPVNIKSN
jgi:signal transduction histidine kinase